MRAFCLGLGLTSALALAACGGDDDDDDGGDGDDHTADADGGVDDADDDDGGGSGEPEAAGEPLVCSDLALCTTYSVTTYVGDLGTPAGGTIRDGVYRKAWEVDPEGVSGLEQVHNSDLSALRVRGGTFVRAGFGAARGDLTVDGTNLTLTYTTGCSNGAEGGAYDYTVTLPFTATEDRLIIYNHWERSDGVEWDREEVYVRVDDVAEVCDEAASEPPTPGDSARCYVSNCACVVAAGQEIDQCF